jgi:hypothetical protein
MQTLFFLAVIGAVAIAVYYGVKWLYLRQINATNKANNVWLARAKEDHDAIIEEINKSRNIHELTEYKKEINTYCICYCMYLDDEVVMPLAKNIIDTLDVRMKQLRVN